MLGALPGRAGRVLPDPDGEACERQISPL